MSDSRDLRLLDIHISGWDLSQVGYPLKDLYGNTVSTLPEQTYIMGKVEICTGFVKGTFNFRAVALSEDLQKLINEQVGEFFDLGKKGL